MVGGFRAFPHRIGYIPHLQGRTRLHNDTITTRQRAQVALEATRLEALYFGEADGNRLNNYALELQLGLTHIADDVALIPHLRNLFDAARNSLSAVAFSHLETKWLSEEPPPLPQPENCAWHSEQVFQLDSPRVVPFLKRPYGVNLIGHAFEILELVKTYVWPRAFQAADIPFCVIHYPAANGASCADRSLEPFICSDPLGGPYAFNLICMTAPMQARWLREQGTVPLLERYTISTWPWETQQWPDAWTSLLDVVDEIWPASSFTAQAVSSPALRAGLPLQVMSMAAEISDPDRFCNSDVRDTTRKHYGLPINSVVFGYGFDLNSTAIRKNPMGALEAFQRAFPIAHLPASFGQVCRSHVLSEHVSLLIKTFPPRRSNPEWEMLKARVDEDSRITLIPMNLNRDELLSLYACCDVFLSLHRSEGFGRGIAEALQLGVDVIATSFGGNTDFCTGPLAHAVSWRLVPIPRGSYPHADGHYWAEPDIDHAAHLCQQLAFRRLHLIDNRRINPRNCDHLPVEEYRARFSFSQVGKNMRDRLDKLWLDRTSIAKKLRFQARYY